MKPRFAAIRHEMPDLEETLDELLSAGEDFQYYEDFVEACGDYEACRRAVAEPLLRDYAAEFRALSREVEQEIRLYLERYSRSRRPATEH